MSELLPIGVVAKRSGVAVSTLHFYEARGLIRSERSSGNQRQYRRDMLRRIAFIRSGQRVGISLERIASALAELPDSRTPNRADWTRLSRLWRNELEQRIEALGRLRDQLDQCIGCGCLSLKACKLFNPDDVLARRGPGARRLLDPRDG